MTHEQFKEKLAEQDAPCHNYHFIDIIATFCDEEECNDLCNPTECWLRVFEIIEKGE